MLSESFKVNVMGFVIFQVRLKFGGFPCCRQSISETSQGWRFAHFLRERKFELSRGRDFVRKGRLMKQNLNSLGYLVEIHENNKSEVNALTSVTNTHDHTPLCNT
mgnify:CR=1 FL=1